MSSDLAIRVEGLGKAYTISHQQSDHVTLAQVALERARHPFQRNEREQFWAVQDLDFEVAQGEVLGLIGRNGAGKSTLLKLLTRITAPTAGHIDLWGRVGSLLEVGTGFHPELTGRENVYLNGSILGMTRKEIDRQFDAIVDFAGVERFLDTPVKRYSSGMYVRLAFAVAAHLETEILLVDEVLAVGDQEFQNKCLGKMHDVAVDGRTVVFVSHQMESIRTLCDRALLLDGGAIAFDGDAQAATQEYLTARAQPAAAASRRRTGLSGEIQLDVAWAESGFFDCEAPKTVHFRLVRRDPAAERCFVSIVVRALGGAPVAHCDSVTVGLWYVFDGDVVEGSFVLRSPWLLPGDYAVDLSVCNAGVIDEVDAACTFSVLPVLPYPTPPEPAIAARDAVLPDYGFTDTARAGGSTRSTPPAHAVAPSDDGRAGAGADEPRAGR
jgi:lipopolysaccharide transport system ATP-binding protein